jgi:ribose transport system ATP-binding protein
LRYMDYILKMERITKGFPGVIALNGMNLMLERGTVMALVGENGAGKSTLIKVLSGAIAQDAGAITLDGTVYRSMTPAKSIANGISVIYQELNLVPQLTVYENIFLGKEVTRNALLNKKEMIQRAREILDSLGIQVDPRTPVRKLSVGFQQLVEVAKAIAQDVKVLVLDEPTSALSNAEVQALFDILARLKARGVSMIYISHRLEEVFEICDKVAIMRDGEFVGRYDTADVDREMLISQMVGRTLNETYPARTAPVSDEARLTVKNLSGGPVRGASFEIKKGEILGFAGLVGAGRTETVRVLFGADRQTGGDIYLDGGRIAIKEPLDAIRAGIGLIPEDRKQQGLNLIASISENISIANLDQIKGRVLLSNRKEQALVRKYIDFLDIKTPSAKKKTMELSGGNQQKVVLAKWLAKDCRVLILDEPTRGIDVGSKQEIYRLMRQLTAAGISILMISSEMPELLGMSDRIAVMHDYKIKKILERDAFSQETILNIASGGIVQ